MAWLDDHPPARAQFRRPRREAPSGVVVVHTAESTPDFVAVDGGAEAVANFIRTRSDVGSYHDLVDSDSCINLVDYDCEAYHDGTGSNRHSYGVSVATRADVWPLAPKAWRDGAIHQAAAAAARYARWLRSTRGIVIPARRITRDESERKVPGFISHGERDPGRRSDPGAGFPWDQFLSEFARLSGQASPQEDDMTEDECRKVVREELQRAIAYLSTGSGNQLTAGQGWVAQAVTLPKLAAAVAGQPVATVDVDALAAALNETDDSLDLEQIKKALREVFADALFAHLAPLPSGHLDATVIRTELRAALADVHAAAAAAAES